MILELHRFRLASMDDRRRKLVGLSRYEETPRRVFYEWDAETGVFSNLGDPGERGFHENWPTLCSVLERGDDPMSRWEIRAAWPGAEDAKPSTMMVDHWLRQALEAKLVKQVGGGTRYSPHKYRLPTEIDLLMDQWQEQDRRFRL